MTSATRAVSTFMCLAIVACGGSGGSSSSGGPTAPTAVAPVTPITVSVRLSAAAPSSATDVTALDPRISVRTAITVQIVADGGTVLIGGSCEPRGFTLPQGGGPFTIAPPGPIAPGSPFSTVFDVPLNTPFPMPATPGSFFCNVTGTDQRGGTVSASQTLELPPSVTTPVRTTCVADDTTICALDGRFQVQVNWRNASGEGRGRVTTGGRFNDGGYFWFTDQNNWATLVQVLNGCASNQRYWVFMAGQTNVETTIQVTDVQSGVQRTYGNPANTVFQPLQDTNAFATCP